MRKKDLEDLRLAESQDDDADKLGNGNSRHYLCCEKVEKGSATTAAEGTAAPSFAGLCRQLRRE